MNGNDDEAVTISSCRELHDFKTLVLSGKNQIYKGIDFTPVYSGSWISNIDLKYHLVVHF